jgi:signal transduction histidine kinase
MTPRPRASIRTRLLLSYLLVIGTTIVGVLLALQFLGPALFDRMLDHHAQHHQGMMNMPMTDPMRQAVDESFRTSLMQAMILSGAIATVVSLVIGVLISSRITDPVRDLAHASRQIAVGDYRARATASGNDEIGDLAQSFNRMAAALEEAESRRVRLIGDVAHELRTPLSTLRGHLEGLQDGVVEPDPALWEMLHAESERLSHLVDDLQQLSRVESGQIALEIRAHEIQALVGAAVERLESGFNEKGIALERSIPPDLPAVRVDEVRTIQILTNLLTNALRYTPEGGEVSISARRDGDQVVLEVVDTGIGIPAEHLPHIFDRFYRVDRARSRALGGSGIGLSIARALAEAQGGSIGAESPGPDQGSTFSVRLPVAAERA